MTRIQPKSKQLIVGEIIVADIIGKGFYQIHSFGETYVNVKLLKLFGKGFLWRGHITNCHNYPHPINLERWLSYKRVQKPKPIAERLEARKVNKKIKIVSMGWVKEANKLGEYHSTYEGYRIYRHGFHDFTAIGKKGVLIEHKSLDMVLSAIDKSTIEKRFKSKFV